MPRLPRKKGATLAQGDTKPAITADEVTPEEKAAFLAVEATKPARVTPRTAAITPEIVAEMAKYVALRLSEVESCKVLGVDYQSWKNWKRSRLSEFSQMAEEERGQLIADRLENIRRFEAKDWRASEKLLKILDPVRFGDKQQTNVEVNIAAIDDHSLLKVAAKVYGAGHIEVTKAQRKLENGGVEVEVEPLVEETK